MGSSKSSNIKDQVPPTVPTAKIDIEITIIEGLSITSSQLIFSGLTKNLKSAITNPYEIEATLTTRSEIKVGRFISSCKADLIAHLEDLYREIKVIKIKPRKGKERVTELITNGTPCIAKNPHTTTLNASDKVLDLSPAKIQVVKTKVTDKPKVIKKVQNVTNNPATTTLWRWTGESATIYFMAARNKSAVSLGVLPTFTPTFSNAIFLASAVPLEPETIAPACPIVFPSGAVKPAT